MLGAAHALANPLTARFNVPHGQAVGLMMPHVIRFNGRDPVTAADYSRPRKSFVGVERRRGMAMGSKLWPHGSASN